jgi:hypothetical protein
MTENKNVQPAKPASTEVDVNAVLAEAQKTGNLSDSKFMALLSIMMAKEARLAEKEKDLELRLQARDAQRRKESESYTIAKIETQTKCKHLKGGKGRKRGQQRDPAVYAHTFTDGTIQIKCTLCSAKWMPKDTREYLFRNGNAIPNWTSIGWQDAVALAEDSSNRPSTSERFAQDVSTGSVPKSKEGLAIPNLQI